MLKEEDICLAILAYLPDAQVEVINPQKDGLHFEATVTSSFFKGKSLIEQHRTVMESLKDLFDSSLHALSLKTHVP